MKKQKGSKPPISTAFPPGSETALMSGRFGDSVYFVRNGKQFRRRFVVPTDRRTPGQLRTRATFAAAAKYWSHTDELTDPERDAWEAAANKIQSRPRLDQSGPLTGQQYFVGRACAGGHCGLPTSAWLRRGKRIAEGGRKRLAQAQPVPQAARAQGFAGTTPEPRYHIARPTGGPGPAVAHIARRCGQRLSSTTRPRAGAGGAHRVSIRRRPEAGLVHPACSSGAGIARFRCGLRKGLVAGGFGERGWGAPPASQARTSNSEPRTSNIERAAPQATPRRVDRQPIATSSRQAPGPVTTPSLWGG